jgi:hypothetical protein
MGKEEEEGGKSAKKMLTYGFLWWATGAYCCGGLWKSAGTCLKIGPRRGRRAGVFIYHLPGLLLGH